MSGQFVFPPRAQVYVAIAGSLAKFPVNRIFCVGRNYHAHALEMGSEIDKATMEPFYFMKDASSITISGSTIPYPLQTADFHYEMEFVIAIGQAGVNVDEAKAEELIFGYACGLDMTRRDLQQKGKDGRKPWDLGKNFEHAAVLSDIYTKQDVGIINAGSIELKVNGDTKQSSDLNMMIWDAKELIAHLSKFYHLQPGDLIYTGTPEGVGPVASGDHIQGSIAGLGNIELIIA